MDSAQHAYEAGKTACPLSDGQVYLPGRRWALDSASIDSGAICIKRQPYIRLPTFSAIVGTTGNRAVTVGCW